MTRQQIEAAIPHRPPMLLLDEIVERQDDRIVCRKTFRAEEHFFDGHYPGQPLVPGVILCEAAMQAGAVLLSEMMQGEDGVPVATRMNDVKFKKMIRPGDEIFLEVSFVERVSNAYFLKAKVTAGGALAVRFDFACTMAATTG